MPDRDDPEVIVTEEMRKPTGKIGNCLHCGKNFTPDYERSLGMAVCQNCLDKIDKRETDSRELIRPELLRSGMKDQSPMYRLYDAIECQLGRHRNSELVPIKMSFRDWNRISRTLEMMFGLHSDD